MATLALLWMRRADMSDPVFAGSAELTKVRSRLSKAKLFVRSTPDFIGVGVVLTIVLPVADVAYLIIRTLRECVETTAGTLHARRGVHGSCHLTLKSADWARGARPGRLH